MSIDGAGEQTPEVSILLVNWNTRQMTLECLQSVIEQTSQTSYEIIVADNGSQDGSLAAIAEAFPAVRLLDMGENLGFGEATNRQAKVARGDKLLLLNTDTVVLDGAIDALMQFARAHPQAGIWGGRTLYADGSLNPTSCWGRLTPWACVARALGLSAAMPNSAFFNPTAYPDWERDSVREVDIVTGCLLLIDRARWEALGGFDKHFFMFGEEADLCLRAARAGARPMITPDATIIHYDGASNRNMALKRVYTLGATMGLIDRHMDGAGKAVAAIATVAGVALRRVASGLAGRLLPRRFGDSAAHWREVWQRREEWRHGPTGRDLES